ncbi:hypothetical protein [Leptospira interrogans]|uniref:hypothetical protein n=1 Tax=Leptospira interrogans TaxID=173 RepID=UPI000B236D7F|nr:hypothetical protein [Leptospira interrogans]
MENLDNIIVDIVKKLNGLSIQEVKIVLLSVENFANKISNVDCNSSQFQKILSEDFK